MLCTIFDMLSSLFQSFLFVWTCNNIACKDYKLSRHKSSILLSLIFLSITLLTYININIYFANFLMILSILLLTLLFYHKSIFDGILGFGLWYGLTVLSSYFIFTFYTNLVTKLNLDISADLKKVIFIYVPTLVIYCIIYILRKYIFDAAIAIKNTKYSLAFVLTIIYSLIMLDSMRIDITARNMTITFRSIFYLVALIVFILFIIYFAKVYNKSKEIDMLNLALNNKITELRKIKHDYGSEISYLYGLYKLKKTDKLGELLKGIIEKNESVNTAVNIGIEANPLVASVLHPAVSSDVNVMVFDKGSYENLSITNNELLKVLSNIIKNSIDVLKGIDNSMIKYKSYNSYDGIIIIITNNGPQIQKEIIDKIFKPGFSTKENKNGDRGYGLSIVSDIIDRCNGKISVSSDSQYTEFKIEIPYKRFSNYN